MEKSYRYRFYPTTEQESLLRQTIGCVRLVFNRALAARTQAWYQRQERVGYSQTSTMLTQWKKHEDLQFLNNAANNILAVGHTVAVCGLSVRPDRHKSKGQLSKTRKASAVSVSRTGRKQKLKS
ncbi:MAG: helix-turn-helix domain-containing protein [Calothrix sp. MO_167.B42]|nr:helix-turn-helix domain-containing protein [Calothrix sp. MO_167.B42]